MPDCYGINQESSQIQAEGVLRYQSPQYTFVKAIKFLLVKRTTMNILSALICLGNLCSRLLEVTVMMMHARYGYQVCHSMVCTVDISEPQD